MKNKLKKWQLATIYSAVIVLAVVLDQLSKVLLEPVLADKDISIIGNWFMLSWTLNDGAAFGMLGGQNIFFFIITVAACPLFAYLLIRSFSQGVWGQVGYSFIIGGLIGNAIDRLFLAKEGFFSGCVRDFFYVKGFAVFNVADSFLVVGTICAVLALLFFDKDAVFPVLKRESSDDE